MEQSLISTHLDEIGTPVRGKVRDIYKSENTLLLISCDRISVFDQILPNPIQDKGKVLNLLSKYWFENTKDIVQNHLISVPDPNAMIVRLCRPLPIEVVVRGYLAGSIWRDYASGKRMKSGASLPEGLEKHAPLPSPIITPTTKSPSGHDTDITPDEIIKSNIVSKELWDQIEKVSHRLFLRGTERLNARGMTLVDTKYEFGIDNEGKLTLIDEVHTPDSSRFWFQNDRDKQFKDKEYARIWAAEQGFMGEGKVPEIPDAIREQIRQGYLDIFETVTGSPCPVTEGDIEQRLRLNLAKAGVL